MLTRSGLGLAIGSVVAGLAGLLFGYAEFVIAGAAGLAVTACSLMATQRRVGVTAMRVNVPDRVARGSTLRLQAHVAVTGRLAGEVVLFDRFGTREVAVAVPTLGHGDAGSVARRARAQRADAVSQVSPVAGSVAPVAYEVRAEQRGVIALGPLGIRHVDPLGLARGRHSIERSSAEVVVHPRIVPLDRHRLVERPAEVEASRRRGAGDPASGFHSLRPYVAGDDTRSVHWPTTARTGVVMVREYTAQVRPSLAVVLLTSGYSGDRFEDAADVAASIAVAGLREGLDVTVRTTDPAAAGLPRPVRQPAGVLDLLSRCRATSTDGADLAGVFQGLTRVTTSFVILGRAQDGLERFSEIADEVLFVSVVDTDGPQPRPIGGLSGGVAVADVDAFARWWHTGR